MITLPTGPSLTYDALVETGVFQPNHIAGDAHGFNGLLYETFGEEVAFVSKTAQEHPLRVATVLECDGRLYLASGFHHVNRVGYFVASQDLPQFDGLALDDGEDSEDESGDDEGPETAK